MHLTQTQMVTQSWNGVKEWAYHLPFLVYRTLTWNWIQKASFVLERLQITVSFATIIGSIIFVYSVHICQLYHHPLFSPVCKLTILFKWKASIQAMGNILVEKIGSAESLKKYLTDVFFFCIFQVHFGSVLQCQCFTLLGMLMSGSFCKYFWHW